MTIAEIKSNPALFSHMSDDIDDFADDTEIVFEAYALSYDSEGYLIDMSDCLASSSNPDEVIEHVKTLTPENTFIDILGTHVTIEVEAVVGNIEDDFLNIGTIYTKDFF